MERIDLTIGNDMANKIMGIYDINWDKLILGGGSYIFTDIKKAVNEIYPYLHLDDNTLVKMIEEAGWGVEIGLDGSYCSVIPPIVINELKKD